VAPKSSPVFQLAKIWENINNIRLTDKKGNEINISSAKEERYFYYLLLCILVLLYLITVSLISSDYFSFDISGISFVNGVESIVVFLYIIFTFAICSPIFIYEYELNKKIKNYDNNDLSNLE
jgi:hypothetical protein